MKTHGNQLTGSPMLGSQYAEGNRILCAAQYLKELVRMPSLLPTSRCSSASPILLRSSWRSFRSSQSMNLRSEMVQMRRISIRQCPPPTVLWKSGDGSMIL